MPDNKTHFIAMSQDGFRPEPEVVGDYATVQNFIKFALPKARPGSYKIFAVVDHKRVFVTDAWRRVP